MLLIFLFLFLFFVLYFNCYYTFKTITRAAPGAMEKAQAVACNNTILTLKEWDLEFLWIKEKSAYMDNKKKSLQYLRTARIRYNVPTQICIITTL